MTRAAVDPPRGLVDFHAHAHPDRASGVVFQSRVGIDKPVNSGAVDHMLSVAGEAGIGRSMIVPWIPAHDLVAERVAGGDSRADAVDRVVASWRALNGWAVDAVAAHPDRLMTLVGVDPILMDAGQMATEVADRLANGASGIKIAPMFFDARPDDERVLPVWEVAREHGVFVLSQAGAVPMKGHEAWGHPAFFEEVVRSFPDVDVVLAHVGRGAEEDVVRLAQRYPNVYTDISLRLAALGRNGEWSADEAVDTLRRVGVDRVLFGTNYPIVDVASFTATFWELPLTHEEQARIGWENAAGLLDRVP